MRIFSTLLIVAGLVIISIGGYQLYMSHVGESERLEEAKGFVSETIIERDSKPDYDLNFNQGDTIGALYIPRLEREIPIIEGTDPEELSVGVGHYLNTGLPRENKQILLSGHRDTVFRQFGELEPGDEFHVQMEHGTFVYVFEESEIVSADDTTVIDFDREDEYLTVSTCYPFSYIGDAPDRYIVYAYPK